MTSITTRHRGCGGQERAFDLTLKGLLEMGFRVLPITTPVGEQATDPVDLPCIELDCRTGSRDKDWWRALRDYSGKERRPGDVVLSNSFSAYPLAGLPAPIVPVMPGTGWVDLISSFRLFRLRRERAESVVRHCVSVLRDLKTRPATFLRRATRVCAVSHEVAEAISRYYRVSRDKISIVPCPVDTRVFSGPQQRSFVSPSAENPLGLLSAGTLTRQKGFDLVIESLHVLHTSRPEAYRLTIVGDGPEKEALQSLISAHQLEQVVRLTGHLTTGQLAATLQRSDLFVLGTVREEGFPLVFSEAMACGVPVVTTRSGGNPSAIREGKEGVLVDRGSVRQLATAIRDLGDNPTLRRAMSQNGRLRAEDELDYRVTSRKIAELLEDI